MISMVSIDMIVSLCLLMHKLRKVYQAFRKLTKKDCLVADVALGRLKRLVGPESRCKCALTGVVA